MKAHLARAVLGQQLVSASGPGGVSGVSLWYDASDASTITDAGSGAVSEWRDKSGNGLHLTDWPTAVNANRPTTGTRTQNGLNVLDFDGSNDRLSITTAGIGVPLAANDAATMFVVYNVDTVAPASQGIFSVLKSYDYGAFLLEQRTTNAAITYGWGSTGIPASGNFLGRNTANNTTAYRMNTVRIDAGTPLEEMRINGVGATLGTYAGSMATSGYMGSGSGNYIPMVGARNQGGALSFYFNGTLAEIVFFNRLLNTTDRDAVESYLSTKWAV